MTDTKAAARAVVADRAWLVFYATWIVWSAVAIGFTLWGDKEIPYLWIASIIFTFLAGNCWSVLSRVRSVRERMRTNQRYFVDWKTHTIQTKHGRMTVREFLTQVQWSAADTIAGSIRDQGVHSDFSYQDVVSCLEDIASELDRRK